MNINTNNLASITEENQSLSAAEQEHLASDEDVMDVSKRLISKNRQDYDEMLAK